MKTEITIYQRPNSRQEAQKADGYTKEFKIQHGDTGMLAQAVQFDNCMAKYKDGYRKGENFEYADCILGDIDNSHSDNESDWRTHEDVTKAMPGVTFYYYPSRNHMKLKSGKSPRPKEHYIFPVGCITNVEIYKSMMKRLVDTFPQLHFDKSVTGPAQLNFGVEAPQVSFVDGEITVLKFMETLSIDCNNNHVDKRSTEKETNVIWQGQRNTEMYKFAIRILREQNGNDEKAYEEFMQEAKKCSPPLEEIELNSIWKSALASSKKEELIFPLPVIDQGAYTCLRNKDIKKRKFNIESAQLFLKAFGIVIRLNIMSKRIETQGLPEEYRGEDDLNSLETLIADSASSLAYKRANGPIIHDVFNVIANKNKYHPVIELLTAKPWDKNERLTELYNILGITDDFYKILVKKWALQTVAILYNSEEKPVSAQGVLVLQGAQGMGKTEFFRHLAIDGNFFKGGATLDMMNKDSLMSATKVWICELGEIDSTTKKEQSALKAFLTEQVDRFREPYARCETIRPRRTSFCGTVNPKGYLRDETGNRRYWTIPVDKINLDKVFQYDSEWYTQFWRQIHDEYKKNPKGYLLTREEQDRVNGSNAEFEVEVYGENEFMDMFDVQADTVCWKWLSAAAIADTLNTRYHGLNIKSGSIGRHLIPRIEQRIGKLFERKTVKGKRLIKCPPRLAEDQDSSDYAVPVELPPYNPLEILGKTKEAEDDFSVEF